MLVQIRLSQVILPDFCETGERMVMRINTVTVIGATGTMGANIAGIFAAFGNAKVYCVGRNLDKVSKTIPRIVKSVRADSISSRLVPADFSMLADCVRESDLVFESSIEDMATKKEIAKIVSSSLRRNAISCTGSSGLSITDIAEGYPEYLRPNFLGVHMFNPPYNMTLCELIPTVYTNPEMMRNLEAYLSTVLLRTVVVVKDKPAFLANRIGFQFINQAMQYAEKYKDNGGIDYIDAILGSFSGRSMAPLVTADFVGLDIHKAIVDNLKFNTSDYANPTFTLPEFAKKLIAEGKLGRKSGEGFYKTIVYDNGLKRHTVYDIDFGLYVDCRKYVFPFAQEMKVAIRNGDYQDAFEVLVHNKSQEAKICLSFLLNYIVYSLHIATEVAFSIEAADDVMATGFNWCPPLALYDALSSVCDVKALIDERIGAELPSDIDVEAMLADIPASRYDYRPYFKSGR